MPTNIKCPSCATVFDVENVLSADVEQKLKQQYEKQWQQSLAQINTDKKKLEEDQRLFEEKRRKENELFQQKLQQEKLKLETELQQQLRKSISADFENQLRILQQNAAENEEKLKQARQKELDFLRKEQELKNKEAELELQTERRLQEERSKLTEEIRKIEHQKVEARENDLLLRQKELEKQLEDQKRLAEEMKRKVEQGSMQLQGEVQELALEEMLKAAFPFDVVCEVGKGVKGADCILTIINNFGQECGRIIFESKRTKDFGTDWIEKLKADMRAEGADLGVIVTQAMPRGMDRFGDKDGIWVCSFQEAKALVNVLRDGVIRIFNATKKHENKGDKMHLLYDYLTSNEFAEQWKAVREGFLSMKLSIQKERDAMEKLWKAREKHLEKVLLNTAYIKGSIEGIAGQDTIDLALDDEMEQESPGLFFK
ncbi:MAG TPA: DUF2130 domain-containing protein [Flavisolibacter sp.]|nr:DUF2130 domain-containing protein [Flavisolibacter sp.]